MRTAAVSVLALAIALAAPAQARAQATASPTAGSGPSASAGSSASTPRASTPRTSTLGWVRMPGAETCPTAQEVARAVEERIGASVFVAASDAELAIEGRAERIEVPAGFRAIVRIADASGAVLGERTLDRAGEDCRALLAPLALAIALTIDPDALGAARADEPADEPDVARIETRVITERVEVPVPGTRWRLEITLGPSVAVGLMPFVAPGGVAAFFLTPPGFVPLMIHGALYPWSRAERPGGEWIDHLAVLAGIGICPLALREDRIGFLACAGIDAGAGIVTGESGGLVLPERERVLVQLDVSARLHVRIVGPLMFHVGVSFIVPFRTEAYFVGAAQYYAPEPIAGSLDLGIGVDLDL